MKINKKVQEKYFKDIVDGRKRFEVRLADFKCKTGDTLVLQEQKQGTEKLTGRKVDLELLYKLNTKAVEKFYSKKDIEKYGLLILAVRRKYK
jgi:ASC-1-like (ASCH) protein